MSSGGCPGRVRYIWLASAVSSLSSGCSIRSCEWGIQVCCSWRTASYILFVFAPCIFSLSLGVLTLMPVLPSCPIKPFIDERMSFFVHCKPF